MPPAWIVSLLTEFGVALVKWGSAEIATEVRESREAAEKERQDNIRNGKNALRYRNATTRQEQIRAAVDALNRNNT